MKNTKVKKIDTRQKSQQFKDIFKVMCKVLPSFPKRVLFSFIIIFCTEKYTEVDLL